MQEMIDLVPEWGMRSISVAIAVAIAILAHSVVFKIARMFASKTHGVSDGILIRELAKPSRWAFVFVGVSTARHSWDLTPELVEKWQFAEGLLVPLIIGWIAVAVVRALREIVDVKNDVTTEDNLTARRKRTRMQILSKIAIFGIVFLTACLMLLTFPSVRNVGVSLLASAGLAGLAVGAAAQPVLRNLIAGIQMAFTQPIRIDDSVIVENEWGWIEDIRLTYVVVKIWDERRLIVPVSRFLEEPFQNWTLESAGLLGSVNLFLDPMTDVKKLRAYFDEMVPTQPLFDGRVKVVQVIDTRPDSIEVRLLATAKNAPKTWDLRCAIREDMLDYIRREMPEAMPRNRIRMESHIGDFSSFKENGPHPS